MKALEHYASPDGALKLEVAEGDAGDVAIGFEGSSWHTHPDIIAGWFGVPVNQAKDFFIQAIVNDQLPIITIIEQGGESESWVSDSLEASLEIYGKENCKLRLWSGLALSANQALKIDAASRGAI